MKITRTRLLWFGLGALLIVAALIPSRGGDENGPNGTAALRRMLAELGADVADAELPVAPPSTFVLLHDLRSPEEVEQLAGWVTDGGTLVVADPESLVFALLGVELVAPSGLDSRRVTPSCPLPDVAGVRSITISTADPLLRPPREATACFPVGQNAFALEIRHGRGRMLLLGGRSAFINRRLRTTDNAVFAARLLGSDVVRFGTPVIGGGLAPEEDGSAWDVLPRGGRAVVLQIALALIVFALARARRIGHATDEAPIVQIPSGELVRASARLLRGAKAAGFAARAMRGYVSSRVQTRGARDPDPQARAELSAREPANDDELILHGIRLETLRRRLEEEDT